MEDYESLSSDSHKRTDSLMLKTGDVPAAQVVKEELEELQRADRKLREAVEKRREAGGPKHVLPGTQAQ